MPKGLIKLNKHTSGHRAILERLGYKTEQCEVDGSPHLAIECNGFDAAADFSSTEAANASVKSLVQRKFLWTYTTEFKMRDPKSGEVQVHTNRWAIMKLPGDVTALIAKPQKGSAKKGATSWVSVELPEVVAPEPAAE